MIAAFIAAIAVATPSQAAFGISSLSARAVDSDGTLDFLAGSHPYEYTVGFEMNRGVGGGPDGGLRGVVLGLPPGLVGNPLAVPRCTRRDLEGAKAGCSGSTQIGVVHAVLDELGETSTPLYNVVAPPGDVAAFGFNTAGVVGLEQLSVRTGRDYGLTASISPVPMRGIESISETIWGVPADPGHDGERSCPRTERTSGEGCASEAPPAPLLSLPNSCNGPLETTVEVDSEEEPGVFVGAGALSSDAGGGLAGLVGCGAQLFRPTLALQPNTDAAGSPAGPKVVVSLPQLESPFGLASANLQGVVADLPNGMTVNLSAAAGLAACSAAQIGLETAPGVTPVQFTPGPAECPSAAKIGTVKIDSPLLEESLAGAVYVAKQDENPFGSMLAIYVTAYDPISGLVIKLPGLVSADSRTGDLTARFTELPQLAFENLQLEFSSGQRAPLATPATCGSYAASVDLIPSSAPLGATATSSPSFRLTTGPGGSVCAAEESDLPGRVSFEAGTSNASAGGFSPFVLRLAREDGTQRLSEFKALLPAGLGAKFAGVPICPNGDLQSCPVASEVGTITVGAGVGATPLRLGGHVFLAGPYKSAPLSLVAAIPATAGPFDLGTVVVRIALQVDPETGQILAVSDRFPALLRGVPLNLRTISIDLDRPGFIHNPTSCEPTRTTGSATTTLGRVVPLTSRFQVAGCASLAIRPRLSIGFRGATGRGGHPGVRAELTEKEGEATPADATFYLPVGELLDLKRIRSLCPREVPVGGCPPNSRLGSVDMRSQFLPEPLTGTLYLSRPSRRLPDLIGGLSSPSGSLDFTLRGRVIDSRGRLGIKLESLPDIPLSSAVLNLAGGRRGILVNSRSLCGKRGSTTASFTAHNGMTRKPQVKVGVRGCSRR